MKEKLYTIPINDAFHKDCECPLCVLRKTLEEDAITYTMGPSYMEADVRAKTDEIGFCTQHTSMLYENQNRLGLALILSTHLGKVNKELDEMINEQMKLTSPGFFTKKSNPIKMMKYMNKLNSSCFICDRINGIFDRYIASIFYMYKTDTVFVDAFTRSKGFCTIHYATLYEEAPKYLSGKLFDDFILTLNKIYLDNMKRVKEELDWFIDKFDYRNGDAPWKNSKDALVRAMTKISGIL